MKLAITGSSSGIGYALAVSLLNEGHEVWGIARSNQLELSKTFPKTFHSSICDVSELKDLEVVVNSMSKFWGKLDGLVTCAGIQGEIGRTLTTDPTQWTKTVTANLSGTYNTLRILYPLLQKSDYRIKVICFSGGGATKARSHFSAYAASKTAIVRLIETIAEEEKTSVLDINVVAPGAINTRLTDEVIRLGASVVGEAEYASAVKQKENGGQSIANVIALIHWLLSDQSNGISGKLIRAQWDDFTQFKANEGPLKNPEAFTLRRITP